MKLLGFLLAAAQAEEDECAPHNGKVSVVELFNRVYQILTRYHMSQYTSVCQ